MTDRPMKMSEKQFEALWDAVVRHVTYTIVDHEDGHSRELWSLRNRAHGEAHRLLVEPEQAKPIHDGPCRGGPLDGNSMAMDEVIVKWPGGQYQWNAFGGAWYWAPTDPDLTTFGELEAGEWFFSFGIGNQPMVKALRFTALGHWANAMSINGQPFEINQTSPIRRLPKPEFKA